MVRELQKLISEASKYRHDFFPSTYSRVSILLGKGQLGFHYLMQSRNEHRNCVLPKFWIPTMSCFAFGTDGKTRRSLMATRKLQLCWLSEDNALPLRCVSVRPLDERYNIIPLNSNNWQFSSHHHPAPLQPQTTS